MTFSGMSLEEVAALNTSEALDWFWTHVDIPAYYSPERMRIFKAVRHVLCTLGLPEKDTSLLDVGCAVGEFFIHIKDTFPHWNMTGVDFAPGAISIARQRVPEANFFVSNLMDIEQEADVVVALEILEHQEDGEAALKKLQSMARKHLIITVPNGAKDKWVGHKQFWTLEQVMEWNPAQAYHIRDENNILVKF